MTIVLGTNAGFVTTAPTANPNGVSTFSMDAKAAATEDTVPSTAAKVTEIGFFSPSNSTTGQNWEVGIYEDTGGGLPGNLVSWNKVNVMSSGNDTWNRVTGLNIDISSFQDGILWIAFQVDSGGSLRIDRSGLDSGNTNVDTVASTLFDPYNTVQANTRIYAIYAVWEAAAGFTRKIKISGTFQDKPIKTKVAGTFVDKPIKIKVGGTFQDA